jgi:hypothetical protein
VVADRGRENRSQIVFTQARGREMVFWQSPRTRKQARPDVRLPTARASGIGELEIVVDAHERCGYRFADQQVRTVTRGLACGDYAVCLDGKVVAAVERKSLPDLVGSLTSGRLRFALGELGALPRAGRGPWLTGSTSPTAEGYVPRFTRHGWQPTAHSPLASLDLSGPCASLPLPSPETASA